MTEDERIQIVYEAMHDATCLDHGPHCAEIAREFKDAIRVGLWRLDEAERGDKALGDPA